MSVKRTASRMLALGAALLAPLLASGAAAAATGHASGLPRARTTAAGGVSRDPAAGHPVVLVGIPGLAWSDISASATPAIWRLAERGSIGSLVDTTVGPLTCPADAWLTLNSGATAAVPHQPSGGGCTAAGIEPHVVHGQPGTGPGTASIPGMASLQEYNVQFGYDPHWGALRTAAGPGQCATAIGPGAGLALASTAGDLSRYLSALPAGNPAQWDRCPLTVADLGALPAVRAGDDTTASRAARATALRTADRLTARIVAGARPGSIVVLAGLGDVASQHLRVIIVAGAGYQHGLLVSASTRQPGVDLITDLTPAIFRWRGIAVMPHGLTGAGLSTASGRNVTLPAQIRGLVATDTAEQVYRDTLGWCLLAYGMAEGLAFGLIAVLWRGLDPRRVRARTAAYTGAAVLAAAVPAGTFLANLLPWPALPHPAIALWGLGVAFAALIAAAAVAGPWRRGPFGPPGFVAAVTLAVIAIDLMAGSRLELEAPFGRSLLIAGRFYGLGNNALGVYGTAGLLVATWAAAAAVTSGSRRRAVAACATVAAVTVGIAGWPGFGAKVGGMISLVPAFAVLVAAVAGLRITPRRAAIVAVSGLAVAAAFAVINYLVPATGVSHLGGFVGNILHDPAAAGATLHRKVSAMLHSVTERWFTPVIPAVAVVTLVMLVRPATLRLRGLISAQRSQPLLRPYLVSAWLAAVLGWLADDSGVKVAAAALPVVLPLAIALVARINAAAAEAGGANGRPAAQPQPHRSGQARGSATPGTAS